MQTVVSCAAPMLRNGIISTLREAGVDAVPWADTDTAARVVVEVVDSPAELRSASQKWGDVPVIAVVPQHADDLLIDAIRFGARAAVPAQAATEALLVAHQAVSEGYSLVPSPAMAAMAQRATTDDFVSPEEVSWLVELAGGATVASVARSAGYSERSLYRLLHGLYGRLGAANRYEAVKELRRRGLVD